MSKLIFGCGYLGLRVARRWIAGGETVTAVTRSASREAELQAVGLRTLVADVTQPETLVHLPDAETVLYAVGYDRRAEPSISEVYAEGVANVLSMLRQSPNNFIYISSTGVYGPAGGEWVDETTPPNPQREGGKASLLAETRLVASPAATRATILRLAGIYGPGRIPYLDRLRSGEPLPVPREGWLNLIHVEDAAQVVLLAEKWLDRQEKLSQPEVFCVSDGHPVMRGEYYAEVARQIGAPPVQFTAPEPGSPRAQRASANKRIAHKKLMEMLKPQLSCPTYREGLATILRPHA